MTAKLDRRLNTGQPIAEENVHAGRIADRRRRPDPGAVMLAGQENTIPAPPASPVVTSPASLRRARSLAVLKFPADLRWETPE